MKTFKNSFSLLAFSILLLLPGLSFAQLWNKSFDKEVNFIKMTEAGVAVVATNDAMYGIDKKGEVLWSNKKLKKLEEARIEVLNGSELIFVSDKGMLNRNRAINVLTGMEYADTGVKFDNIMGATIIHPTNSLLVVKENKKLEAWDIATNKKLWEIGDEVPYKFQLEKMASMTATFKGMQPITYTSDHSGILHLCPGHLANYDFKTGKQLWAFNFKPYKFKKPGGKNSDSASYPSKGFATMKIDLTNNTLYFPFRNILIAIDSKTGQAKWDVKANKFNKVKDIQVLPEGILVLDNNNTLNLIDPASGEKKWAKPLKVKGASDGLLVQDGDKFFMVSKKYIMEIDVANKTATQLTDKIKFQGGESFSSIEMVDDLIILSASQNIVGINKKTGDIVYHEYYKAPSAGLKTILQNVALAAVAVAATQNSQRLGQQNADALGHYKYYQYTPALRDSGTRNSVASRNYMYINTKFKGKGFGLARVDKKSGDLVEKIIIGDRSPTYAKDENASLIFYKSSKKEVACKKLGK